MKITKFVENSLHKNLPFLINCLKEKDISLFDYKEIEFFNINSLDLDYRIKKNTIGSFILFYLENDEYKYLYHEDDLMIIENLLQFKKLREIKYLIIFEFEIIYVHKVFDDSYLSNQLTEQINKIDDLIKDKLSDK